MGNEKRQTSNNPREYKYIASYTDKAGKCWDLILYARGYNLGLKDARAHQCEYGKLWSFRRVKD